MTLHLYKIIIVWIYDDTEWTNTKNMSYNELKSEGELLLIFWLTSICFPNYAFDW